MEYTARKPGRAQIHKITQNKILACCCRKFDRHKIFFSLVQQPNAGPRPSHSWGVQITRHTTAVGLPRWVISPPQRPLLGNTRHLQETDIHSRRWDSNPQFQQAIGRRPSPETALRLGSARQKYTNIKKHRATPAWAQDADDSSLAVF